MLTVLQIMDYAAPYKGNFINSIERLEDHLNKVEGRLIYLLPDKAACTDWASDLIDKGKRVYFIDYIFFSKKIKLKNVFSIISIIRKEKIDIIHTHFVFYNYTLFLLKKIFLRKIRIIGHFHNHFNPPNNYYRYFKIQVTDSTFNQIIGVSKSVAESVINTGINSNKVSFIPNAIDFERLNHFVPISLKTNDSTQKVVLIFGWPYLRKGVDLAIDSIKIVRKSGLDVILVISLPGGKEQIVQKIAGQSGNIPEWIRILDSRNDVGTYYNAADIFLSAGREEGMNYSVIEAAYETPMVIISNIPGNPQEIPELFKFELENVRQLSELIITVLSKSEDEKKRINNIQRNFVLKKYDLDIWCEEIINHYN